MTRFLFALGLPVVLALGACTGGYYKSPEVEGQYGSTSEPNAENRQFESGIIKAFPDIPIPASHKVDLERSVIFTSPTQTMGKIALVGNGDVDTLYRFFEDQMTSNGWSMVNAFQSATSSMYFAKPGRFVAIIIEADGKNSSRVYLNVGPE